MPERPSKRGRPKLSAEEVRNIRFEIRLSQVEVDRIKRVAHGKLSTWMRTVLLGIADALDKKD